MRADNYALSEETKRVRDLERANEWCVRVRDIATRFGDRQMFSVCRTHYADVLLWHGDWTQADQELAAAVQGMGLAYLAEPLVWEHQMGIKQGGSLALLGCGGAMGIGALDYLVITHYHADHVGGMEQLEREILATMGIADPYLPGG